MKAAMSLYKMVILIGVLMSLDSLGTAILASMMNIDWETLKPTAKFLIIVVIGKNWASTMIAFLNKTVARVEQGKPPIDLGPGSTYTLTKEQVLAAPQYPMPTPEQLKEQLKQPPSAPPPSGKQ